MATFVKISTSKFARIIFGHSSKCVLKDLLITQNTRELHDNLKFKKLLLEFLIKNSSQKSKF